VTCVKMGSRRGNCAMHVIIEGSRYHTLLLSRKLSDGSFTDKGVVVNPATGFRTTIASCAKHNSPRAALLAGIQFAKQVGAY
jgi:hypothetical protein